VCIGSGLRANDEDLCVLTIAPDLHLGSGDWSSVPEKTEKKEDHDSVCVDWMFTEITRKCISDFKQFLLLLSLKRPQHAAVGIVAWLC